MAAIASSVIVEVDDGGNSKTSSFYSGLRATGEAVKDGIVISALGTSQDDSTTLEMR